MIRKNVLAAVAAFACSLPAGTSIAPAQAPASSGTAAELAAAPAAVVTGLNGLLTATDGLKDYRSIQRAMAFRIALTEALRPGLDLSKPVFVKPPNKLVLCSMRGKYAAMAAQKAYVTSITTTLNQFAAPSTISTIGDAFKSVFQNYTIDAAGKFTPTDPMSVVQSCNNDIDAWPLSYYGAPLVGVPPAGLGLPDIGGALGTFNTLVTDLTNIITPIATAAATSLDAKRRSDAIKGFLTKFQGDLLVAASSVADNGNALLQTNRLQALGQFEEKVAAARTFKIDLSKSDACKAALAPPAPPAPAAAPAAGAPAPAPAAAAPSPFANSDEKAFFIPTDEFVSCYAQAWTQLNDVVQATIAAASQYDALADPPSDQLKSAVKLIQKNIDALNKPDAPVGQFVEAATQLITIGKAVQKALSPDNIKTLEADANNVMALFK